MKRWLVVGAQLAVLSVLLLTVFGASAVAAPLEQEPGRVPVLIAFSSQPGAAEADLVRRAGGMIKYTYHLVPAIAASVPESAIPGLLRDARVVRVEPDIEVHAIDQALPWGVDRIDAEVVHGSGNTGSGVKVAILDTGIDLDHPDLQVAGSYNCAKGKDADDKNGHGTHVAGTVAALDNTIGVIGVAPGAALYAVKVLGNGGIGSYSDVICGLEWSLDSGMQVTNNSYGSSGDPGETVKAAFDNAYAAGLLHIAAAGNEYGDEVIYPAKYESVVAVSATTDTDELANFSSKGPEVELAAPGKDIYSTYKDGGYATFSGTSMASPHVAGVAALVWAENSGWSNAQVRDRLQQTAEDLGASGKDDSFGYGLVDAENAVLGTTTGDNLGGSSGGGGGDDDGGGGSSSSWGVADVAWSEKHRGPGGSFLDLSETVTAQQSDGSAAASVSVTATLTWFGDDGAPGGGDDDSWNFSGSTDSEGKITFVLKFAPEGNYQLDVTGGAEHDGSLDVDGENPDCYDTTTDSEFTCP